MSSRVFPHLGPLPEDCTIKIATAKDNDQLNVLSKKLLDVAVGAIINDEIAVPSLATVATIGTAAVIEAHNRHIELPPNKVGEIATYLHGELIRLLTAPDGPLGDPKRN